MARYFFALDIEHADKQRIADIQSRLTPALPKPTKLANLHLTLVFLGQVLPEQLAELLKSVQAFSQQHHCAEQLRLVVNHTGLFEQAKVLYLGLERTPSWLARLVSELETEAINKGLAITKRRYQPHITISRKARELPEQQVFDLVLKINSFSLYVSESAPDGVRYTPLATFSLTLKKPL